MNQFLDFLKYETFSLNNRQIYSELEKIINKIISNYDQRKNFKNEVKQQTSFNQKLFKLKTNPKLFGKFESKILRKKGNL